MGNPASNIDPTGQIVFVAAIPSAITLIEASLFVGSAGAVAYGAHKATSNGPMAAASYGPRPTYSSQQEAQLDKEYKAYKYGSCQPPPGLDQCEAAKWRKNNLQRCINDRQSWDNKWWPKRHADEIQGQINRLAKADQEIAKYCKCP